MSKKEKINKENIEITSEQAKSSGSVEEITDNQEICEKDSPKSGDSKNTKSPKKKKSKKFALIVTFIFVMALVFTIWVISQVLSNGYISIFGYSLFRVASGSMEPELPVGTLILSKSVDIEDIEEKDIVNFRSKETGMVGMIITHRVIGIYESSDGKILLETKGDANQYTDTRPVDEDNLVGKMVYKTKQGNFFASLIGLLTSKIGFWAFIVLPCILVGVFIMRDTIGTLREEMDNIHKELDEMSVTVNKAQETDAKEESYEEMYERLRTEVLEELRQGAKQSQESESDDLKA